ncbi:hypothetical protein [Elongatibacter sediminis]|uniref:DUF2846 domain-containing protein n=1 Tax=Elongatibacter sediminis TaxID=3119006 RepID=A0AAW9RKI5_9GAMM
MKNFPFSVLLVSSLLTACVSANPEKAPHGGGPGSGSVVFYRTHSLQATLADAYIGTGDDYFLQLDEDEYTRVEVKGGFHQFRARAQGSVSSDTRVKVNPGETVCVEARPNYEELEWLAVPFVNAFIPSFVLEETPCPSAEEMSRWTRV